ncbi:MAG: hypothetical protein H3C54_07340 [Taibaiella sp.]|nr:hypothetical protein [Taibaiella sp.]
MKNKQLRLYFISDPDSAYFESDTFNAILDFIQKSVNNARLKQVGKNFMLVVENIKRMSDVHSFLDRATQAAQKPEANKA